MADLRTVLAAVLGVGLGVVLIAAPGLVVRMHTMGRVPRDRGGKYGADASVPDRWLWVVRAVGALVLLVGLAIGLGAVADLPFSV